MSGFTAYHGSPFLFDRFDLAHAYSGEGAQTYGRGIYLACHPDRARDYAQGFHVYLDGEPWFYFSPLLNKRSGTTGSALLDNLILKYKGDVSASTAEAASKANVGDLYNTASEYREAAEAGQPLIGRTSVDVRGFLYTVRVAAERAAFVGIDQPIGLLPSAAAAVIHPALERLSKLEKLVPAHGLRVAAALRRARKSGQPLEPMLMSAGFAGLAKYNVDRDVTEYTAFSPGILEITAVERVRTELIPPVRTPY